jgi:hypothetical protein
MWKRCGLLGSDGEGRPEVERMLLVPFQGTCWLGETQGCAALTLGCLLAAPLGLLRRFSF